jgi:hypothetical protein
VRRPRSRELHLARELAELVMLDAALEILDDVLVHEHPCIDDLGDNDPPGLLAARSLLAAARALRAQLRRYRAAVLQPDARPDELPF